MIRALSIVVFSLVTSDAMADALAGPTSRQGLNPIAIAMFLGFVAISLAVTLWAAKRGTRTASDFYTAGSGLSGFKNGLAIAGDYTSAATFLGVTALVYTIAHMVIYFALRRWDFGLIANDMTTRLTLVVATLSTIGLILLGATSVDAAIAYMGAKNWQRLHTTNYVISGLAILHVMLARGTYTEQYMLTGIFFWLMVWRVLARYGLGANAKTLALLAVASCLVAAFLEAGFLWSRRGFDVLETLGYNFSLAILDVAYPPAWQVLALGLLVALGAAGREALRLKAPIPEARQAG